MNSSMKNKRVHFTNPEKAKGFAERTGGRLNENKDNQDKPFTVSIPVKEGHRNHAHNNERGYDFDSDLNMGGMNWHTSEDL